MIASFWAALTLTVLCVAIGAIVCVRKLSALTAAADRLGRHPLFVTLRTANASSDKIGRAARNMTDASRKLGDGFRAIGEALGAVATYATFVTAIAKSVEELLEVFVPTLGGYAAPTEHS